MTDFPIHIAEEHSATLAIWWQHRASPKTAVYIDAHLDLQQISDAHIHQLKQCEHRDQLNALEAPHHLNQSDQYAYGIENFLHAAHELKLIDRLIWVVPPHIPRNYSQELLAYIQQMDGIGFEEMMRFQPVGENALRGTLLGLDITLCDYSALEHLALEQDYYLDIDIDYFVKVPEDQLWVDPAIVIQSIIKQLGPPTLASISLAVSSGFTPLSLRFIGDYIESILKQDTSEYQHFQQLINLHTSLAQNQYDQAVSLGQQLIESKPNCAASHFMLSKALSASNAPVEQTKIAQQRAAELDSAYIYNLSSEACGFPNRFKPLSINQLNTLVSRLNELDPADSQYTHIAVAQLLATHQHLKPAWQIAQNLSPNMQHHPELMLNIAQSLISINQLHLALPLLETAAKSIKTRTTAAMLRGDIYFKMGDAKRAQQQFKLASEYAPAWLLPLEQQLLCLEVLSDTLAHEKLSSQIEARKYIMQASLKTHSK